MPHYGFIKNLIKDKENDKAILHCYKIKKKMSECIKSKGNIEDCGNLSLEFNSCIKILDKRISKTNSNVVQ